MAEAVMYRLGKGKINAYSSGSQPGRATRRLRHHLTLNRTLGLPDVQHRYAALSWSVASPLPTPYRTLYHRVCIVTNLPLAALEKHPRAVGSG
jgi:hypothetical protein